VILLTWNIKPKAKEHILEDWELEIIEKELKGEKEELVFYGLLGTGCRVAEFSHIHKSHIVGDVLYLQEGFPCSCTYCARRKYKKERTTRSGKTIQEQRKNGYYYHKNRNSSREIGLSPETMKLFFYFFKKGRDKITDFIPSPDAAYMVLKNLYNRILRKEKKDPDRRRLIHKLFPHCLRATHAKHLVDNMRTERGFADPYILADAMGWSSIETSMQYISGQESIRFQQQMKRRKG